eukprot:358641-Chlamydomonas_euryale.AAC.2
MDHKCSGRSRCGIGGAVAPLLVLRAELAWRGSGTVPPPVLERPHPQSYPRTVFRAHRIGDALWHAALGTGEHALPLVGMIG